MIHLHGLNQRLSSLGAGILIENRIRKYETVAQVFYLNIPIKGHQKHMRSSNKSRQRNKNNNRRQSPNANVVNRVFDSSGPSGKVRGTPQQIVEKYATLAADATLAGDRVAAENYMQHSEHYSRMLRIALKEQAEKQAEQQKQQAQQQQAQQARHQRETTEKPREADTDDQPPMAAIESQVVDLVETPENKPSAKPKRRSRTKQAAPTSAEMASEAPAG